MSLADGAAYEKEFGRPEYCPHGIAVGCCLACEDERNKPLPPLMTCRKVLAPGLEVFCLRGRCAADDGPEVEVIKAIRATHYPLDFAAEWWRLY